MKSMQLTGLREMEMREVADPVLTRDDDVLIRMSYVGVCGSDVHYYTTGRIGSQVVQYPFAVGHECAGVVEAVGRGVKRLKPGDSLAIDPAMPCGTCDQCLAGRTHTCRNLGFLGCPGQAEGCLCELLVMPESSCFLLKPNVSLEQGALSEPLSIGVYSVHKAAPIRGQRIAILGAGPIGLSVLAAARLDEPARIYMTDRVQERVDFAGFAGADWVGHPDRQDVVAEILTQEPLELDVVFECCGQQEALDQAVRLLKPGGKLILVGIPEVARVSFEIDLLRRREILVQNIRRQVDCVAPALELLEHGDVQVDRMVTHRFPFARTKEAFELVANYADGVIKAMIRFD